MKKLLFLYVFLSLMICNISAGKTKEGLFGLKLGEPIDQSIIINEVKKITDTYNYLSFYIGQDGIAYQVEPPEKNKIFTHYFVLVYPISKKIYEIYAYRDSWDKRYDGKYICEKKTQQPESSSSVEVFDDKPVPKCSWANPETPIQQKKFFQLNNQYFKALEKYLVEKYKSNWRGRGEYLDTYGGYLYMIFEKNILKLSSPRQKKLTQELLFGSGRVAPVEFGISLGVIEKDESEFLKLLKDKEEKKIQEEEKLYNKILDKTGL